MFIRILIVHIIYNIIIKKLKRMLWRKRVSKLEKEIEGEKC